MARRPMSASQPREWVFLLAALAVRLAFVSPAFAQTSHAKDAECLACHSQPDLKSASGHSVYVDPARHKASVHADLSCTTCHTDIRGFPHPAHVKIVACSTCHQEEASDVPMSVHSALGADACTSCHGSAHDARAADMLAPKICGSCHADELKNFLASAHGAALKKADAQAPSCETCHGSVHKILTAQDPGSPVAKKNQPATCGSCHSNSNFLSKHAIEFAHPVETYLSSVHGRAVSAGNENAASCANCHSAHEIRPAADPKSAINHWNVPRTCGACHGEIEKTFDASVHGQAVAHGAIDAPVCTDCHGDHSILAPSEGASPVNPARVSLETCGRCHGDARLSARYDLPADRVPTFADSFHGLAGRAGSQTVANCASCHGVHNIFPSSDPRSTVNAANLARTCGACHPGAGQTFAIGPVHVGIGKSEPTAVKWIRRIYWILIPLTIGFMFSYQFLDFWRKFRRNERIEAGGGEEVQRMNLHFRIAHWLTVVSFPVLVVTGFALKYPEAWWARPMLLWESHFAFRGTLHRIAAVILLASLAYHIVHLSLVRKDRSHWREMLPGVDDLRGIGDMFLYNLGLSDSRPVFGRFSYVEKIEYLAFMWGTVIMAITGFLLWFNGFTLRHFPKWVSDAATALHFYEAILATAAIAIWHMYTVVFDPEVYPMDRSWLTGNVPAEHLRRTRPAYYAEIKPVQGPERSTGAADTPERPPGEKDSSDQTKSRNDQA